jgi:hypothetical protein
LFSFVNSSSVSSKSSVAVSGAPATRMRLVVLSGFSARMGPEAFYGGSCVDVCAGGGVGCGVGGLADAAVAYRLLELPQPIFLLPTKSSLVI